MYCLGDKAMRTIPSLLIAALCLSTACNGATTEPADSDAAGDATSQEMMADGFRADAAPDIFGMDADSAGDPADQVFPDVVMAELPETIDTLVDGHELWDTEVATPFPFGEPCQTDEDCQDGLCLETPVTSVCSTGCQQGCPEGWACWPVEDADLCVPPEMLYCSPCDPAVQPPFVHARCVPMPGGHRYLLDCGKQDECKWQLVCVDHGQGLTLCEPPSGSCDCLPLDEGLEHPCDLDNEYGVCQGSRTCLGIDGFGQCLGTAPKSEVCNGNDDDCDGTVDEDSPNCAPGFCLQEGLSFHMKGAEECQEGQCLVPEAEAPCGLYACDQIGAFGICLSLCQADEQCVVSAYCDSDGQCIGKLPDGSLCDQDNQCNSGHCNHGLCCQLDDCCFDAEFCPDTYGSAAMCDDPAICQGHRQAAACANFMCQDGPNVPDDSACNEQVLANECGTFPPVYCNGLEKQSLPGCAKSCLVDEDCLAGAHCDATCKPDLEDGFSCNEDSDCVSKHCAVGLCCSHGTCCDEDGDCVDMFAKPPVCGEPVACQGIRIDALCVNSMCASTESLEDDSACTADVLADDCGFYRDAVCNGDDSQVPPTCLTDCKNDAQCDPGYACVAAACVPKVPDGAACGQSNACTSDYCGNGFCCSSGDCCQVTDDCPKSYEEPPACLEPTKCQGLRTDAVCNDNVCGSVGPIEDDSGCGIEVVAANCAPYPDLLCSGQAAQLPPSCASACENDEQCSLSAHCDDICKDDLPDGYSCDEDTDCVSSHCVNGVCCKAGDCCIEPNDCPPVYSSPATCEMPAQCQGVRVDALCESFQCKSTGTQGDDSGCGPEIQALDCGDFKPVYCNGAKFQVAPSCPATCSDDQQCLPGFHCDGKCLVDLEDGGECDEDSDCQAGHCANAHCCVDGACCKKAKDCPPEFSEAPACGDPSSCQGSRVDAVCQANQCSSTTVDDDSGCTVFVKVDDCGPYDATVCAGQEQQKAPSCPDACTVDGQCDPEAHCATAGVCLADFPPGASCSGSSQCLTGHCVNGFCCAQGTCCAQAADCPETYAAKPECDNISACQGFRMDRACVQSQCQSEKVDDDSACDEQVLVHNCGPNPDLYCTGEEAQAPPLCSGECLEDVECGDDYHCDDICKPDIPNGLSCDEDSDCQGGHCANGFCCATGDCCQFNYHCPDDYQEPASCDQPTLCQGSRMDRKCSSFVCLSESVPDDSACGGDLLAQDCGEYQDVYCSGQMYQVSPSCPSSCKWDSECDADSHCDGVCNLDLGDGDVCNEDSDCMSGHCANGSCCQFGTCCQAADDCPASFSAAAHCVSPASCQGNRTVAVCEGNQCGSVVLEDDSGCTVDTVALTCGNYADMNCAGGPDQPAPACSPGCDADEQCDPGTHCDDVCIVDLADGEPCDEDGDCDSGHCGNGFCCAKGDCCDTLVDCPPQYTVVPVCTAVAECQGQRLDATCNASVCASEAVQDDSACADGMLADGCGAYPAVFCTGSMDQSAPSCAQWCVTDEDCDEGAHCDGICVGNLPAGSYCNEDSDCLTGHCDHGICCSNGDCCLTAAACPSQYKAYASCDEPSGCQGHRVDPTCDQFVCGTVEVQDDSGCGWWVAADGCGLFAPASCNGAADQQAPDCPETCLNDGDCDSEAHCDGVCKADLSDGEQCDENSDCQSAYCANGYCCQQGQCCGLALHCPDTFTAPAVCDEAVACQGTSTAAACQAHECVGIKVPDDSACSVQTKALDCSPYKPLFCTGTQSQLAPACPAACLGDGECVEGAHCDDSACVMDLPAGAVCDENSDCTTEHCVNGFCCAQGDCCFSAFDCPEQYWKDPECTDSAACQGKRTDATCKQSACGSVDVPDDSACAVTTPSDDCGPYKPTYCNGKVEQLAPECPAVCTLMTQCEAQAHCKGNQCQWDLPDGSQCDLDSDCESGYCGNGFCCAESDCCSVAQDCPPLYQSDSDCGDAAGCQGTRGEPTCINAVCDTQVVPDDTACDAATLAHDCGSYPDVYCSGQETQAQPSCATGCEADGQCDPDAHCDGGFCLSDLPDGQLCVKDSDCVSDHCGNNYCCQLGVCCAFAGDCPDSYSEPSSCYDEGTCQGSREDAACQNHMCASAPVADDTGCTESTIANPCGFHDAVFCSGQQDQTAPPCPDTCSQDDECDEEAHCDEVCEVDLASGQPCDEPSDCITAFCVDDYCCNSACPDPGYACDVGGKLGQCWQL